MKKFEFNEKNHVYTLDGKNLTGVTTILGVINKPALIPWASKMVADTVLEKWKSGVKYTQEEIDAIVLEAKKMPTTRRDMAADVGVIVHKAVEEWIGGKSDYEILKALGLQAKNMFSKFREWATDKNVKFLGSEQRVYSEKYWYAGTFDMIAEIDGKKYLGDLKTTSGIYGREPFAQCAAYRLALEEMKGEQGFNGGIVVRVGKDGSFEVKYSYDYETDKKIFLACLDLYRGLQTFKK